MLTIEIMTVFILGMFIAATNARSLLHIISDTMIDQNPSASTSSTHSSDENLNVFQNTQNDQRSPTWTNLRVKRDAISSSSGNCPVLADTAVYVDNKLTFLDFNWNDPEPAPYPDQGLTCPTANGSWWPASDINLKSSCPWVWDVSALDFPDTETSEFYPKYLVQAKCLCEDCINSKGMGCKKLLREKVVYKKIGCDGDHPVLDKDTIQISVGCVCVKDH